METENRRLDGNAAAGMLQEVFPFDMTMVRTWCASCGKTEQAGEQLAYMDAPGLVLRCLHCESPLMRLVHGEGRYWLDMRGMMCLQIGERSRLEGQT
jgi:Family of unknown function (DUF6510)